MLAGRSARLCQHSEGEENQSIMSKLYQIHDDDLATLESTMPQLAEALYPSMDNRLRVQLRRVQKILSDVRWNYGPPSDVSLVKPDEA